MGEIGANFVLVIIFIVSFVNLVLLFAIMNFLPKLADLIKKQGEEPPEIITEQPEGGLAEVQPSAPYNRLSEVEVK